MCWSTRVQSVRWCRAFLQFSSPRVSIAVLKKRILEEEEQFIVSLLLVRGRENEKKKKVSNPNCANGHCFETSRQMMTCF